MTDEEKEKKERFEKLMNEMENNLNEMLVKQVADGEIDEHEARERYFHGMTLTMLLAR